jgi:hypothetical protein
MKWRNERKLKRIAIFLGHIGQECYDSLPLMAAGSSFKVKCHHTFYTIIEKADVLPTIIRVHELIRWMVPT